MDETGDMSPENPNPTSPAAEQEIEREDVSRSLVSSSSDDEQEASPPKRLRRNSQVTVDPRIDALYDQTVPTEDSLKRGLSNKCGLREPSSCIALELVGYVDRVLRTATIQLSDNLMIVDESNGAAAHVPVKSESLARSGSSLEDQAQQVIFDKLWNFATTRSIRYRMLDNADLVISGAQEQDGSLGVGVTLKAPKVVDPMDVVSGRGRNKNFGPILAAAAMKFGLLGALTFKGLTLLVGKALLISKIALLLSTIIGLKKLFSHQSQH